MGHRSFESCLLWQLSSDAVHADNHNLPDLPQSDHKHSSGIPMFLKLVFDVAVFPINIDETSMSCAQYTLTEHATIVNLAMPEQVCLQYRQHLYSPSCMREKLMLKPGLTWQQFKHDCLVFYSLAV